jgi:hypothetical protein
MLQLVLVIVSEHVIDVPVLLLKLIVTLADVISCAVLNIAGPKP